MPESRQFHNIRLQDVFWISVYYPPSSWILKLMERVVTERQEAGGRMTMSGVMNR